MRPEISEKMERIARVCGSPATWGELRNDFLAAGATEQEADEQIAKQKEPRDAD